MRIIILGSGGREHTLAWKLATELGSENVFIAPGNGGTSQCGTNVEADLSNFDALKSFCLEHRIDVILPGSEESIAAGVRDFFERDAVNPPIFVLSPDKFAAQLESSKSFAKAFMQKHHIPTAAYGSFTAASIEQAYAFLDTLSPPYVLKADGLAAGKGVLIIENLQEARVALKEMLLDHKFGQASSTVVIEEFLEGIEFSVFVMTDGNQYVLLPEAKDYKRIGEGDTGLNTGGMGAVSPVPFFDEILKTKTIKQVIEPTISGLKKEGLNYRGFVFFGLINVEGEPKVIEYNVRMGDPETEVVIPRLNESLSDIISAIRNGKLQTRQAKVLSQYCSTVFSVAGGYPEDYEKGKAIVIDHDSELLFHAGTKRKDQSLFSNGGRVIAATALGANLPEALQGSYELTTGIRFDQRYYRKDIGQDLLTYISHGSL